MVLGCVFAVFFFHVMLSAVTFGASVYAAVNIPERPAATSAQNGEKTRELVLSQSCFDLWCIYLVLKDKMKLPCLGNVQEDLRVPFCRCEPQEPEAKAACFFGLPSSGALGTSLARSSCPIMEMIHSGELTGSVSEALSFLRSHGRIKVL